jgi:(E)-4-hydroxy-3-methylbut-2-enyl-diphosphate synthase
VTLGIIQNFKSYNGNERSYSLHSIKTVDKILPNQISFLIIDSGVDLDKLTNLTNTIFILETNHNHGYADQRRFFMHCIEKKIRNPIIIKRAYHGELKDEFLLYSSTDVGGLQIDGFGDGVWIESDIESGFINEISFGILQASRSRISKTEYISCPSCGRTLFDLQETTAKIRARTDHLKGIKIGVMGCIVNGPGEMADADYGYVGTGVGQISLYKGQDVVEKNIPEDSAVDQLIKLIESYGDWVEPSNV